MSRARAFTLMEVLIAIVILAVAVLGILALHTATAVQSSEASGDAFVAGLVRSVDSALREGRRQRPFCMLSGQRRVRGFIVRHAGVGDAANPSAVPVLVQTAENSEPFIDKDGSAFKKLAAADDVIFFPPAPAAAGDPEPIFVFPRPDGAAVENAAFTDDWKQTPATGFGGQPVHLRVKRTYAPQTQTAAFDAASAYSFAITVRRAPSPRLVVPGDPSTADDFAFPAGGTGPSLLPGASVAQDGLYRLEVLVYRNFEADPSSRHHLPVRTFQTLIAGDTID